MLVIDTGILVALLVERDMFHKGATELLREWRDRKEVLLAPRLIQSEVVSIIRRYVYLRDITFEVGEATFETFLNFDIQLTHDDDLLRSSLLLAHQFDMPRAYDTQYLALAQRLNCDFWTTDKKLYLAVVARFPRIHLLGEDA